MQSLLEVVIGDDRIRVTEEHPFRVTGEGWVSAEALEPGDCVRTLAGTCQAVVSVQLASADTWVYNFTIAAAHTYFVGDGQWLVHNRCNVDNVDPNKLDHILGQARHNLNPVVNAYGTREAAYNAVYGKFSRVAGNYTNAQLNRGIQVSVRGFNITVRGTIVDGVARIGTFFIP